jgi:hypothetical protein
MRWVASFLLLGVALAAGAADVWRWKDANGVTHYSDMPVPGAERVSSTSSRQPSSAPMQMPDAPPAQPTPQPTGYTRCEITAPQDDATFFAANSVDVAVAVEPALQASHRVKLYVNGVARKDWPEGSVQYTLGDLDRGSYKLELVVVDERQRVLCNGSLVRFHIRQPSVLSPARQAPKPPPKPTPKPLK